MSSGGTPSSGAAAAGCGQATFSSPHGSGASGTGGGVRATGQLRCASHGWRSASQSCGRGHVEVNGGRQGRGLSACSGSAASASGALATSGAGPGYKDADMDYGDDDADDNDYKDDTLYSYYNDDNDDKAPGEVDAPWRLRISAAFTCWLVLCTPTRTTAQA